MKEFRMNKPATDVPLYRRLLGADFDRLPPAVRALHDLRDRSVWTGRADVERGASIVCKVIAAIAGLPPAGPDQPLTVTFNAENGAEIWHRSFDRSVFRTRQTLGAGVILEKAGPARLTLAPKVSAEGLSLALAGVHVLGIPAPRILLPNVETREYEKDGRYYFTVEARISYFGLLVRYAGWLEAAPVFHSTRMQE